MTEQHSVTASAERSRRYALEVLVAISTLAFVLLAWTTFDARDAARQSAASSRGSAEAVSSLTEILNRRAPTLEYMACHDRAADAVELAYNSLVNALLDVDAVIDSGDQAKISSAVQGADVARKAYNESALRLEATSDPNAPALPEGKTIDDGRYRCPALPIP